VNPGYGEALDSLRSILKTTQDTGSNIRDTSRLQLRITQFAQPPEEEELKHTCEHASELALQNDIAGAVKEYKVRLIDRVGRGAGLTRRPNTECAAAPRYL
jgi:hypothetical protein